MSTAILHEPVTDGDDALDYRALHTGALIAFVLGLCSASIWATAGMSLQMSLMLTPIPVVAMFFALRAISKIRQHPDQYTGLLLAKLGLAAAAFFLVTGVAYGSYIYLTEVPTGYSRVSFNEMKPDELQERAGMPIPPEIMALNGKKIFIKGYIRPGSSPLRSNIDNFLLVRDNNQCCFGDLSKVKYFDQMIVQIVSKHRVDDNLTLLSMGGVLVIHPENLARGPEAPVFELKADYAVQ